MSDRATLMKILDVARWAPSGDNTQPWRFEICSENHLVVHGFDTRDWCVYDFRGYASQMAHGALLETLRLAATEHGLDAEWTLRSGSAEHLPIYDVVLSPSSARSVDPLLQYVKTRCVQRRPMRMRALSNSQKSALCASVGEGFELRCFETLRERLGVAQLLWANAKIRLTCQEAFEVHRRIIMWGETFSEYGIPERAVGVGPVTARLMRWVMGSWQRVEFFNRYLAGTIAPRIQLDVIPALACSAHLMVQAQTRLDSVVDRVRAGVAMQRLWLTAAEQGLHLQPEMTPVIFRWYARTNSPISSAPGHNAAAEALSERLEEMGGIDQAQTLAFFCRVGVSTVPTSRSVRLPLEALMQHPS